MTVIIDGKSIAAELRDDIQRATATVPQPLRLAVVACAPNFETLAYLDLKQRIAGTLGIALESVILPKEATTEQVLDCLRGVITDSDGVLIQLPLPAHIDTDRVLAAVPKEKDVDAFSYAGEETTVLPPVIGAIAEIAKRHGIDFKDKQVVICGAGRLVGKPAFLYMKNQGALVTVCDKDTVDVAHYTQAADVIILGVGQPHLLTPDMVKEGVVVFDAGASEDEGVLVGDADPLVAKRAALFTPVPGGIGPITVALLFRNLLELQNRQ